MESVIAGIKSKNAVFNVHNLKVMPDTKNGRFNAVEERFVLIFTRCKAYSTVLKRTINYV